MINFHDSHYEGNATYDHPITVSNGLLGCDTAQSLMISVLINLSGTTDTIPSHTEYMLLKYGKRYSFCCHVFTPLLK